MSPPHSMISARPQNSAIIAVLAGPTMAVNVFTLAALAAWFALARTVPDYQLPGPLLVLARMPDFLTDPTLRWALAVTFAHVVAAFAIAFVLGSALAGAAYRFVLFRALIDARITPFLNAFSAIGWLFLAILWFGLNSLTVIFTVTMILIPFTTINIRVGLNELDRELVELGQSLTDQRMLQFRKIVLPLLVPYIFATLRNSFGVCWKVVLTSELFGGNAGLGFVLNTARQEFDTATIFAIIVFILLFNALIETAVFRPIQNRLDRRYKID
jgi:NitT/TauT family transport system permease protein